MQGHTLLPATCQAAAIDHAGVKKERIYFNDIHYIEAMQNYVTIHTQKGKYLTLLYLKNIEQTIGKQFFIRVHKSYIVSIPKIETIENNEIMIQSFRISTSRMYLEQVIDRVVNDRLWKKSGIPESSISSN